MKIVANKRHHIAFSSVALVGLAASGAAGVASVLFYMSVYVVMTLGAFLVVLRMRDANDQPVETIASLSGLSRTRPMLALAMAIFMFSLAGIPPLFGFVPKLMVFNAAVEAHLTWLAAVAIATSVIGAYYYIMIVKLMYFDEPAPAFAKTRDRVGGALILASALFVSPLGYLAWNYLDLATQNAAQALF